MCLCSFLPVILSPSSFVVPQLKRSEIVSVHRPSWLLFLNSVQDSSYHCLRLHKSKFWESFADLFLRAVYREWRWCAFEQQTSVQRLSQQKPWKKASLTGFQSSSTRLERRLPGYKHLLLMLRTGLWFPATTWDNIRNSSSRGSNALFGLWGNQTHMCCTKHSYL